MDAGDDVPPVVSIAKRKYVTRACDLCKRKRIKCNGQRPCHKCIDADTSCTYDTAYLRGPKRQKSTGSAENNAPRLNRQAHTQVFIRSPFRHPDGIAIATPATYDTQSPHESLSGDASARGFLTRVFGHLSAAGHAMPRYLSRPADRTLPADDVDPTVMLPDKTTTLSYLECFAQHAQVTYRYVSRRQWSALVERLYDDDESLIADHANMALLLLLIGLGCIWYPSWKNKDFSEYRTKATRLYKAAKTRLAKVGSIWPPTVLAMQAHTLEAQLLLTMNHFNAAWVSLGAALRTGQIIGLHRKEIDTQHSDDFEETNRRACFWALFMLDRYLSTALGRPMMLNENDITIPLPDQSLMSERDFEPQEVKLMAGMIAHVKLVKIIGRVMNKLYPATCPDMRWTEESVLEFEHSLLEWQEQTPDFYHPSKDGEISDSTGPVLFEIPWSFKRQQRTVRMTYYFTTMLMYRGCLLDDFLRTTANTPNDSAPSLPVQKCVQAAIHMASFAAAIADDTSHNAVFWTTSYFTFCAISILVVYLTLYRNVENRAELEQLLERAMRGHRRLDQSTELEAQRLLEESKKLTRQYAGAKPTPSTSIPPHLQTEAIERPAVASNLDPTTANVSGGSSRDAQMAQGAADPSLGVEIAHNGNNVFHELFGLGEHLGNEELDMIMDLGFDRSHFDLLDTDFTVPHGG